MDDGKTANAHHKIRALQTMGELQVRIRERHPGQDEMQGPGSPPPVPPLHFSTGIASIAPRRTGRVLWASSIVSPRGMQYQQAVVHAEHTAADFFCRRRQEEHQRQGHTGTDKLPSSRLRGPFLVRADRSR